MTNTQGLIRDDEGVMRCWWAGSDPLYLRYHDEEWGRPVTDDTRLFEKICLEGFQAGLSWLTILRKREAFRAAFAGFDVVARGTVRFARRHRLLDDAGIVRHRGKIESVISNARRARTCSRSAARWRRTCGSGKPTAKSRPQRITRAALMDLAITPESKALSKDLKRRGWTFVGPTTIYAFMQAVGIVNDHIDGCSSRAAVERARNRLVRPVTTATEV